MKMVGDNNDGGGDDDDMKDDDDEIWCLLVPAFRTGDKANVPTYLPHGFPPANTVEHILQIVLNIFWQKQLNAFAQTHCGGRRWQLLPSRK